MRQKSLDKKSVLQTRELDNLCWVCVIGCYLLPSRYQAPVVKNMFTLIMV